MSSLTYSYIDGDNIGLTIESSFMENNESSLAQINERVRSAVCMITEYLLRHGQEIIFSGADGIICKGETLDLQALLNLTRGLNNRITFSAGTGESLRDAYIALRYAKSIGKNVAVNLIQSVFIVTDK